MQNPYLRSKIKIPKKHVKLHSTNHLQKFCAKKELQKTLTIREMRNFGKSAILPKAKAHAKSSLLIKNMSKSILQIIYSCSVQKTAPKNTKYSRNESILKIGHRAKAIAHAKSSLWVKN